MFPFQTNHYGIDNYWSTNQQEWVKLINGGEDCSSIMSCSSESKKPSESAACKSHKEAERRRRQRINAHLSTLRTLLPNATKTDKASLLAEVVNHVKELRRQAADVAGSELGSWPFPGETDELSLTYCDDDNCGKARLIKATLCCEDRPGLNRDLNTAIGLVRARAVPVRAEMMTVGGRTKNVVVMEWAGGSNEEMGVLRRALKQVVENRVSGSRLVRPVEGNNNKRARVDSLPNDGDNIDGN